MIDFFFLVPIGLGLAGRPREAKRCAQNALKDHFVRVAFLTGYPSK